MSARVLALTALLLIAPAGFAADRKPAPRSPALTKGQKEAAGVALKALRKLHAAIEVGVTYADYRSRLIDAKVDVEEQARRLPDGKVKVLLAMCVKTHQDALTLWRDAVEYRTKSRVQNDPADWAIITGYKLPWTDPASQAQEVWEKDVWMKALWMIAGNQLEGAAEAAA